MRLTEAIPKQQLNDKAKTYLLQNRIPDKNKWVGYLANEEKK